MNARIIAQFIKDAVKDLSTTDRGATYYLKLDNEFAVYVGWSGGFEPTDEGYIHSKADPEYCLSVKIAEWNPSDIDYGWMYMPWDVKTEEVWDTDMALTPHENYYDTAKWLNREYREMRKALREGRITFSN